MGYDPDNDFDNMPEEEDDILWNPDRRQRPHREWDEENEWDDNSWDDD